MPAWARIARPRWLWRDRRTILVDGVLSLACSVPVVVGAIGTPWWTFPLRVLVVTALIAGARLYPLASLAAVLLGALLDANVIFMAPVLALLAGRRMPTARPALVVFAAVVTVGSVATPLLGIPLNEWVSGMVILLLTMVFPWLVGRSWRQYQDLVRAGWQRADQLEREQEIVSAEARLRERARIASDMHDSLGHELSLLGVRAGALELAPGLTDEHRAAVRELRAGAADATEHLRDIIGVLREDTEHAPTGPVRESITALVQRANASGMEARLDVDEATEGPPPPAMVDRAAYRVVQEALTNAAKHAPGTAVTVQVRRTTAETVVRVRNDQSPDARPAPSGGRGLVGLDERVRLVGGTLRTHATGGGFELVASLPHTADGGAQAQPTEPAAADAGITESARRLAHASRRVRRSLVASLVIPGAIGGLLVVVMATQYAYKAYASTMSPQTYRELRVGQERTRDGRVVAQPGVHRAGAGGRAGQAATGTLRVLPGRAQHVQPALRRVPAVLRRRAVGGQAPHRRGPPVKEGRTR